MRPTLHALFYASLLAVLPTVVQAQFTFTTNNGALTITDYTGPGGTVIIPSSTNGLLVVAIGDVAFLAKSSLTSVVIPNTVTSIGNWSFQRCSGLTSVTIPSSVTSIGDYAFYTCYHMTAITVDPMNGNYSSLDGVLFNKSQSSLIRYPNGKSGNYNIPNSVTSIVDAAFADCSSLIAINVDPLNGFYSSLNGVLFSKAQSSLIQYPGGKSGSYNIPSSVISIGNYAFYSCSGLTNVTIPSSVTIIGAWAFGYCTGLTSVTIPDSVIDIGNNGAFAYCSGLASVKIGNRVTSIGYDAFYACSALISVTIPNSVISIGNYAFRFCSRMTSVSFQGNAPRLGGDYVFEYAPATAYYLQGRAGWGATYGGRPAVLWNPTAQTTAPNFDIRTNGFGFNITGTADIPIVIEATTNLAGGSWVPLQSSTLTNGLVYFSDPAWTNYPTRHYRIRSP